MGSITRRQKEKQKDKLFCEESDERITLRLFWDEYRKKHYWLKLNDSRFKSYKEIHKRKIILKIYKDEYEPYESLNDFYPPEEFIGYVDDGNDVPDDIDFERIK